jgi:peptidoglycan/xylan/chitin deacetylase (PgdA/CDA1 family)
MMTKKIAYLTIDDAPSLTMNEKADYLSRKGIPAVWFCRGDFLEQWPNLAIHAIQKGFVLGNHSYNHLHFSELGLDECLTQIRRTDEIIEALYKSAGVKRPTKCFRFPYGDKGGQKGSQVCESYSEAGLERKQTLQTYLRQLGYTQPRWEEVTYRDYRTSVRDDIDWYWTYDVLDWSILAKEPVFGINSLEKVFERMDGEGPGGYEGLTSGDSAEIVLMHDHTETAAYFEPIVERLLGKGLVFLQPNW